MRTLTATEARKKLYKLLSAATTSGRVVRIRHRLGNAILLSEESYESLVETLRLLSIPGFRQSISRSAADVRRGRTRSIQHVLEKQVMDAQEASVRGDLIRRSGVHRGR